MYNKSHCEKHYPHLVNNLDNKQQQKYRGRRQVSINSRNIINGLVGIDSAKIRDKENF